MSEKLIVCFSTSNFDAKIWTNKQHLMSRLAKRDGYRVIYVDQGLSKQYIKELWVARKLHFLFYVVRKRATNLYTVSPPLPLIRGGIFKRFSWFILARIFQFVFRHQEVIYWVYQPQAYYFLKGVKHGVVLYDCVDDFQTQPFYSRSFNRKKELQTIEPKLLALADYVTVTSLALYEDKKGFCDRIRYIHNVGDFSHFSKIVPNLKIEEGWIEDPRIKVMYAGVIDDYKTDVEVIANVANDLRKTHLFIFVGPNRIQNQARRALLESLDNVCLLGHRNYLSVPSYLNLADILWIPYLKSYHTSRVFPIKVFEYFSTKKPVVMTNLPSVDEFSSHMFLYDSYEELLQLLKSAVFIDDDVRKETRYDFARKNTWDSRLNKILEFMELPC